MTSGYGRAPWHPRTQHRNRNPGQVPPGLYVRGTVYYVAGATQSTVLAMAEDHYGVSTLDELAVRIDPQGPRTMEEFCQAWWGKPFADCIYEILALDRYINLIRQSSRRQTPGQAGFPLHYYGGDLLDTCITGAADPGRRVWIGSDYLVASLNSVDLNTNILRSSSLPNRNHLTGEFKNNEVDLFGHVRTADALGGGWRVQQGAVATWIAPNQTDHPGTIYWPLCITTSSVANRVAYAFALLVETPTDGQAVIDVEVKDTHVLHLNVFGTASETGKFDIGPAGNWYAQSLLVDTSFTYVYGLEFVPPVGDFTPNHGENIEGDTEYTRVARIAAGTTLESTGHTGTVYTNYEWWTGSGWSSDRANAARIKENNGKEIRGYCCVVKVATDHYMLVAQDNVENKKRLYFSTTPQGPWWNYRNVPCPPYGLDKADPANNIDRASGFTKVYTDWPAPANHMMTLCTNLPWSIASQSSSGGTYSMPGKHMVNSNTPYSIAVPTEFGEHSTPPPPPIRPRQHLLVR